MLLIKIGGGKNINWEYISADISQLIKKGERVIVIHGASATRDEIGAKFGVLTKTVISPTGISSVYTDQQALDIFLMSYAGLVNKKLVATMEKAGIHAVGLSGVDGGLWIAKKKTDIYVKENDKIKLLRGNMTGRVIRVNGYLLRVLLDNQFTPVLCPPAITVEGEIVNTDNDWASAMVAGALGIKRVVSLFEAPGLLKDVDDPRSVIYKIKKNELDSYISFAKTRMKKKVLGAKQAFELGVETIYWGDGRMRNPVINALEGKGTIIQ